MVAIARTASSARVDVLEPSSTAPPRPARRPAARRVVPARGGARTRALLAVQPEQPRDVRVRAEAAVAHADRELGAQPRGDQRVRDAVDDEGDDRQPLDLGARARARARPAAAASPSRRLRASARSWASTAGQPIAASSSRRDPERDGAEHVRASRLPRARAGSVHTTSSRSTSSTAPPPARNGVAGRERGARPDQRSGAERRVQLVPAEREEVRVRPATAGAARAARRRRAPGTPRSCAAATIGVDGGIQPVTFDAPVIASRRGARRASSAATTASAVNVPSALALDEAAARRPHPRQQVRVVLDDRRDHHVVGLQRKPVRQVVDRLGRVAADDRDVVAVRRGRRTAGSRRARPRRRRSRAATCSPAPRCTLAYHGSSAATRSATAGSALVEAAQSRFRYGACSVQTRHGDVVADKLAEVRHGSEHPGAERRCHPGAARIRRCGVPLTPTVTPCGCRPGRRDVCCER